MNSKHMMFAVILLLIGCRSVPGKQEVKPVKSRPVFEEDDKARKARYKKIAAELQLYNGAIANLMAWKYPVLPPSGRNSM